MTGLDEINEFKYAPQMRKKLGEYGSIKTVKEGESIVDENCYIRMVPIVLSGTIKVLRTDEDGKEILLYYIKPGESCIMSFLGGLRHEKSKIKALAEEETEILLIPVDKVGELIKEFPEWLDYIFKLYHKRFEELLEVVNAIAFKKMDERLLDLLHKKSENTQSKYISITHEQLANELGTARVVVSRLLKQMQEEGLIIQERHKITLV